MASDSPIPPATEGLWLWSRSPAAHDAIVMLNKICALEVISGGNRFPIRFGGENAVIELSVGLAAGGLTAIAPYSVLGNTSSVSAIPTAQTSPILTAVQFGASGGTIGGSAGAIAITAAGSNKNIILTPSGTGYFQCPKFSYFGTGADPAFSNARDFNVMGTSAGVSLIRFGSSRSPFVELISRATVNGSDIAYWDLYANSNGGTGGSDNDFTIRCRAGSNTDVMRFTPSKVTVLPGTNSTSSSTGALVVIGGLGVGIDLNVQGLSGLIGGARIDAGGYLNFGVTTSASGYGVRDNAGTIEAKNSGGSWSPIGTAGIGGSSGSTDNAIIRADGTGGVTVQSSGATIDDSGVGTFAGLKNSALTSGRIVFAGASGVLQDDAGLTFPSGILTVTTAGTTQIKAETTSGSGYAQFNLVTPSRTFTFAAHASAQFFYIYDDTAGFYRLLITSNGNVLIGTTSETGLTGAGGLKVASTTTSTSTTTGAAIVAGGVGIGENLNVGGTFGVAGASTFGAPAKLMGYTVAALPAGAQGQIAYATDLLAPGFLVAAVGGGAVVGPVFYNGSAWVAF